MISDNYLMIRRWIPNFNPFIDKIQTPTTWFCIPGLSSEYFHPGFLTRVRNLVGTIIRIDKTFLRADRGQFVRLAVEIDLTKPLLPMFRFRGQTWYEGIRKLCFHCGKIGHLDSTCPALKEATESEHEEAPHPTDSPDGLGVWNKVIKPGRKTNKPSQNNVPPANCALPHQTIRWPKDQDLLLSFRDRKVML
ncbi:LOW QUALITY PROTEIN: hypothetical protein V2J09_016356 [Rumex salicifolius]